MPFDFTTVHDRAGKDALAFEYDRALAEGAFGVRDVRVREGFDLIPMWVADMNFATAPAVSRALARRIEHPLFGYFYTSDEYYRAIARWHEARHGLGGVAPEHIAYENGVLGGVVNALNVLCSRGDTVLLHSPTYIGFTGALENAGYRIVLSSLVRDAEGVWRMDFDDMAEKIERYRIHACVFCSPHNPCGRVWERSELERAAALFEKCEVTVVCDEIWSDILLDGHVHTPFQTVSPYAREHTIALHAPSKTFNIAGLVGAYRIVFNRRLQERLAKEASLSHYNEQNVLSQHALIGGYSEEGAAWVDELNAVLSENARLACDFIEERFPGVSVARPQGTYMLFMDCERWCAERGRGMDELIAAGLSVGVLWKDGRPFHGPWSIRLNLALPTARMMEALERLDVHVFNAR